MNIEDIARALENGLVYVTDHADEEAANDNLTIEQVIHATLNGEIIEDYPHDRPYPSCLIFGYTQEGEPVHSVWAYNPGAGTAVLVTVYRPDPARWIGWKKRKRK